MHTHIAHRLANAIAFIAAAIPAAAAQQPTGSPESKAPVIGVRPEATRPSSTDPATTQIHNEPQDSDQRQAAEQAIESAETATDKARAVREEVERTMHEIRALQGQAKSGELTIRDSLEQVEALQTQLYGKITEVRSDLVVLRSGLQQRALPDSRAFVASMQDLLSLPNLEPDRREMLLEAYQQATYQVRKLEEQSQVLERNYERILDTTRRLRMTMSTFAMITRAIDSIERLVTELERLNEHLAAVADIVDPQIQP